MADTEMLKNMLKDPRGRTIVLQCLRAVAERGYDRAHKTDEEAPTQGSGFHWRFTDKQLPAKFGESNRDPEAVELAQTAIDAILLLAETKPEVIEAQIGRWVDKPDAEDMMIVGKGPTRNLEAGKYGPISGPNSHGYWLSTKAAADKATAGKPGYIGRAQIDVEAEAEEDFAADLDDLDF